MFLKSPTTDLIIVLVVVLLIFGPKRLPGLGRSLGTGLREFKESITGESKDEDADRPTLSPPSGEAQTSTGTASPTPDEATHAPQRDSTEVGSERRS